ncbi:MAG TPA: diguanylate cyclase [Opitutaceae bacterium]|nr:diguanylate cyclase [Opitutaceae bacterium]
MAPAQKILLIDDDPAIARLVGLLLTKFRRGAFALEWAADYEHGLQRLLGGAYALCLLDFQLGDRNGLDLLREAKAASCHTPVILLTGFAPEEIDLVASEAGASAYLEKVGLEPRHLERAVCYALETAGRLDHLREAATHDELTGAFNRREFDRRLAEAWRQSLAAQRPLALLMIDLDHFKEINDTHGHQVGDAVLRHVGRELAALVRSADSLARYGGDEFAIIMPDTDRNAVQGAAERMQTRLAAAGCALSSEQRALVVELSIGVAASPDDAATPTELISAADAALYAAKQQSHHRVRVPGWAR